MTQSRKRRRSFRSRRRRRCSPLWRRFAWRRRLRRPRDRSSSSPRAAAAAGRRSNRPRTATSTAPVGSASTPAGASTSPTTTTARRRLHSALDYVASLGDISLSGPPHERSSTTPAAWRSTPPARSTSTTTTAACPFPAPVSLGTGAALTGSEDATGVAVDPATDHALRRSPRDHVSEYDASGSAVRADRRRQPRRRLRGRRLRLLAATAGYLYVPDAADDTVKVYDPAIDTDNPVATIAGAAGGFASLRDSAVAVDNASGEVYVVDDTQPEDAEEPRARIDVFDSAGPYVGHLKYDVIDGAPDRPRGRQLRRPLPADPGPRLRHLRQHPPRRRLRLPARRGDHDAPLAPTIPAGALGGALSFRPCRSAAPPAPGRRSPARATPVRCCPPSRSTRP